MPAAHPAEVVARFDAAFKAGNSVRESARMAGVGIDWAYQRTRGKRKRDQAKFYANERDKLGPKPKAHDKLKPEAQHALDCFQCFRLRYTGRRSLPWQVEAANRIVELTYTPDREYAVINAPPGGGKTTLFTHDIPLWLVCRDRSIKILIGAAIQSNATKHSNRLRRTLQASKPAPATDEELAKGMVDPVATVAGDFGRFKPDNENPDLWTATAFSVAQQGVASVADKEPTVQAYGRKGGVLGNRVRFCIWDDLVDAENTKTADAREDMRAWWKSTAETRINRGGLIVLQGQRMGPDDLYQYALDMKGIVLDDDGFEDLEAAAPAKYQHIVYKAHYDELCTGAHPTGANRLEPWPASCLLDPYMLPWRDLMLSQRNGMDEYLTQYQQESTTSGRLLVNKMWVTGGSNEHGEVFPGCWDHDRGTWELPPLAGDVLVYATVDPSPTRWWGIQAWAYHPMSERHFLLDLVRKKMSMSDFLDWDPTGGELRGMAVDFHELSLRMGYPLKTWIVEKNSYPDFAGYGHTARWQAKYEISLIAHATALNKSDPKYGVQALGPLYRHGRVRLPGRQGDGSRLASLKLVDEVTKWPEGSTDDQVMAQWFGFWNLKNMYYPAGTTYQFKTPRWLRVAS